jgi:hypothetical protein
MHYVLLLMNIPAELLVVMVIAHLIIQDARVALGLFAVMMLKTLERSVMVLIWEAQLARH